MQHEITASAPLLDEKGNLRGRATPSACCPSIAGRTSSSGRPHQELGPTSCNDHFAVALTIADNGYMGLDSVSFLQFDEGWQMTRQPHAGLSHGPDGPAGDLRRRNTASSGKRHALVFRHVPGGRELTFRTEGLPEPGHHRGHLLLTQEPEESMVICTPFDKPATSTTTRKSTVCGLPGRCVWGADIHFDPADSFGVLDWGRGVWTYHNTWYWGSASRAGGWRSLRLEHRLWLRRYLRRQREYAVLRRQGPQAGAGDLPHSHGGEAGEDYLAPWRFTSDDGRFEMDFAPILDRAACTDVKLIKSDQHQVFGRFTGTALLDDGTPVRVKDLLGFAEKVENKW